MKLLVIGASRGIGRKVVDCALARGHEVRAFSRRASALPPAPGLDCIDGDALDPAAVSAALPGVDAVVLTLGVKAPDFIFRPVTLFSRATEVLVNAMQVCGVTRLLVVTGVGAGDSYRAVDRLQAVSFKLIMGRVYADKTRQEEIIRQSGLDWTIARPGFLTHNRASGRYRVLTEPKTWRLGLVSRADVAEFLVEAAETGRWSHEAPVLVR